MVKGKKGGMQYDLVKIVSVLIASIVILGVGQTLRAASKDVYELRACHDALVFQQKAAEKLGGDVAQTARPWPASCQTVEKTIETGDREEAMRQIAQYMMRCWWSLGGGGKQGIDPFAKNLFIGDEKCFNCFLIKTENVDINAEDFNNWLMTTHINYDENRLTYWNYLKGLSSDEEGASRRAPIVSNDIKPGEYYSVAYVDQQSSLYDDIQEALCSEDSPITPAWCGVDKALKEAAERSGGTVTVKDYLFLIDWNKAQEKCITGG